MEHRTPLLLGIAAAAGVAIVGVYFLTQPAESGTGVPAATEAAPQAVSPSAAPAVSATAPELPASSQSTVARLIADTASPDAAKRAAAITALAEAPKAEALPVLGKLLTDGEPQIDRPLALRSLRELALNQGDDDGAVRDAVRKAIYHGDDFTKVDEVQETLDLIEESQAR
jgi:HEAT repeat protein